MLQRDLPGHPLRVQPGSGRAHLAFARRGDRTRLIEADTSVPFTVQRTLYLDPGLPDLATVFLTNTTAGIFQGDGLQVAVRVEEGARALITSRSATKIHSMPEGSADQRTELTVEQGGLLEYVPEPLIPFCGSRFSQTTHITVQAGGALIYIDIFTPGRLAYGEAMEYDRYSNRLLVSDGAGRPLLAEAYELRPAEERLNVLGMLDSPQSTIGTLIAVFPGPQDGLLSTVSATAGVQDCLAVASALPAGEGVVVKVMSSSLESVRAALHRAWSSVRTALYGCPPPDLRR